MSEHKADRFSYVRYADFLRADRRRTGDALEFGRDWRDGDASYRVCWYEQTGELTAERIDPDEPADLENFHRGVRGPIEILGCINREELDALLGEWPNVARGAPRTLRWLRELLAAHDCPGATV